MLGIKIATNMSGRIKDLRELEHILAYLDGELRYRHSLLGEALHNVAGKTREPFRRWLLMLCENLDTQSIAYTEYSDFYSMWRNSMGYLRDNTYLTNQDIDKLLDTGKALGYLDIESQQMNLNLERELIHNFIASLDKDIGSRMKNAIILCFLGGIMVVIALL